MDVLLLIYVTYSFEHILQNPFNLCRWQLPFLLNVLTQPHLILLLNDVCILALQKDLSGIDDMFFFSEVLQHFFIVLDMFLHFEVEDRRVMQDFGVPKLAGVSVSGVIDSVEIAGLDRVFN